MIRPPRNIQVIVLAIAVIFTIMGIVAMSCKADVTRYQTRTIRTDLSIVDVIKRLGFGALGEGGELNLSDITSRVDLDMDSIQLWVDGKPADLGIRSVIQARRRIHGIVFDTDREGSVQYRYAARLPRRGVNVIRETYVSDGYLKLTTTLSGALGQVSWVRIVIVGRETSAGTLITGTMTAHVPLCFRCRLVNRIAHRIAPRIVDEQLCIELRKLEGKGRELAEKGEGGLLDLVIKTVARLRSR